eukprot:gene7921-5534_t
MGGFLPEMDRNELPYGPHLRPRGHASVTFAFTSVSPIERSTVFVFHPCAILQISPMSSLWQCFFKRGPHHHLERMNPLATLYDVVHMVIHLPPIYRALGSFIGNALHGRVEHRYLLPSDKGPVRTAAGPEHMKAAVATVLFMASFAPPGKVIPAMVLSRVSPLRSDDDDEEEVVVEVEVEVVGLLREHVAPSADTDFEQAILDELVKIECAHTPPTSLTKKRQVFQNIKAQERNVFIKRRFAPRLIRTLPVTYYDVLSIPPTASTAEIRAAYLHQLRRYSPYRHVTNTPDSDSSPSPYAPGEPGQGDDAKQRQDWDTTLLLYHIYRTLRDPVKRQAYDTHLAHLLAAQQQRWQRHGGVGRFADLPSGLEALQFVGDIFEELNPLLHTLLAPRRESAAADAPKVEKGSDGRDGAQEQQQHDASKATVEKADKDSGSDVAPPGGDFGRGAHGARARFVGLRGACCPADANAALQSFGHYAAAPGVDCPSMRAALQFKAGANTNRLPLHSFGMQCSSVSSTRKFDLLLCFYDAETALSLGKGFFIIIIILYEFSFHLLLILSSSSCIHLFILYFCTLHSSHSSAHVPPDSRTHTPAAHRKESRPQQRFINSKAQQTKEVSTAIMPSNAPTKQPTASRAKPATRVAASGSTPRHRTQPADPPASTYRPGSFAAKATTNPKPHRSAGSAQQPSSQPQPQPVVVEVEDVPGGDSTGALKPTAVPTIVSGHRPVDVQEARLVRRDGGGGTQREVRVDEATKARAFRQRDAAGNQMYGYSYNSADDPTFQQRHGGGMHVQTGVRRAADADAPHQASLGAPPSRSPTTTTTAAARTASTTKTGPGPCSTAGRAWAWIQCGGTPSGSALPTGRLMQRMMAGGGMFGGFDDDDFFFGSSPMLGMMGGPWGGQQQQHSSTSACECFVCRQVARPSPRYIGFLFATPIAVVGRLFLFSPFFLFSPDERVYNDDDYDYDYHFLTPYYYFHQLLVERYP